VLVADFVTSGVGGESIPPELVAVLEGFGGDHGEAVLVADFVTSGVAGAPPPIALR
jgi:hypothetical protein